MSEDLCKDIRVKVRDINKVVKDSNHCILKAAHTTILRRSKKIYKPYLSELEKLHAKLSEARVEAETNPSQEVHITLQQAQAKFVRHKLEPRGKA